MENNKPIDNNDIFLQYFTWNNGIYYDYSGSTWY